MINKHMSDEYTPGPQTSRGFLWILLLPVLLALLAFRVVPMSQGILRAFGPAAGGMSAAPWINGVLLTLAQGALAFAVAVPASRALSSAGSAKGLVESAVVLPFFLPTTVLTVTLMAIFGVGPGASPATPGHWIVAIAAGTIQYAGIATLVGASHGPSRASAAWAVVAAIAVRLSTAAAPAIDIVTSMSSSPMNPVLPIPYASVFGLMTPASAAASERAWLFQAVFQAVLIVGAFLAALRAFRRSGGTGEGDSDASLVEKLILWAWAGVCAAIVLYVLLRPIVSLGRATAEMGMLVQGVELGATMVRYLIVALVSTVLAVFFVVTAAYPLVRTRSRVYVGVLLLVAAGSAPGAHDYFYYRSLGMLNTFYPYLIRGFFPVVMAFALAWHHTVKGQVADHPFDETLGEPYRFFHSFVLPNRKAILTLALLQFALTWGHVGAVGIYMTHGLQAMSPATMFRSLVVASEAVGPGLLLLGLIVSVPPILLYVLLKGFAANDVLWAGARW